MEFLKVSKSDYIDNYIKYNESRLKFKKPRKVLNKDEKQEEQEDLEETEHVNEESQSKDN